MSSTVLPDGSVRKAWKPAPTGTGSLTVTSRCAQLGDGRVEVGHPEGEVLATVLGRRRLDQVELLAPGIEPRAGEPEVGPVVALDEPQHVDVEVTGGGGVGHVDGHVVDGERLHAPSLPASAARCGRPSVRSTRHTGPVAEPDQPRRMALLAPMKPELRPLVRAAALERDGSSAGVYRGTVADVEIAAMMTGIGMDGRHPRRRADPRPRTLRPPLVVGIAGGIDPSLRIGDVVVPEVAVDQALGHEYLRQPARPHRPGRPPGQLGRH